MKHREVWRCSDFPMKKGRSKAHFGLCPAENGFDRRYTSRFAFLRTSTPSARSPVPNSPMLAGSGVRREVVPEVRLIEPPLYGVLVVKYSCADCPLSVPPP